MLFTFLSLPRRAAELAAVEGDAIFVQDAEDGAAAVETAHRPDVVDAVPAVVHRDDGLLVLGLLLYHLYTTVPAHPFLVCVYTVVAGGSEYVSYFCHCIMFWR